MGVALPYIWCWHLEGLVVDPAKPGGVIFTKRNQRLFLNGWDNYTFMDALDQIPANINSSIDIDFNFKYGSANVSLIADATVCSMLMNLHPAESGELLQTLTSTAVTIPKAALDGPFGIGSIIYIADETIIITDEDGADWEILRGCGCLPTADVAGHQPIGAQHHNAGSLVYDTLPYAGIRRTTLFFVDYNNPMGGWSDVARPTIVHAGLLDGDPTTSDDQTCIHLVSHELITSLLNAEGGRSIPFRASGSTWRYNSTAGVNMVLRGTVTAEAAARHRWAVPDLRSKAFLIDDCIWICFPNASGGWDPVRPLYDIYPNEKEAGKLDAPTVSERVVVDRRNRSPIEVPGSTFSSFALNLGALARTCGVGVASYQGEPLLTADLNEEFGPERLGFRFHPIAIALSLILSRRYQLDDGTWNTDLNNPRTPTNADPADDVIWHFDLLEQSWGAGVDVRYVDWESFLTAIHRKPSLFIEQLEFGDGTYNVLEVVSTLLATESYFLVKDDSGRISLGRFADFTLAEAIAINKQNLRAALIQPDIPLKPGKPQPRLPVQIGKTYRENGGTADIVTVKGNRQDSLITGTSKPFDFNMFSNSRLISTGFSFVERKLSLAAHMRAVPPPTLKFDSPFKWGVDLPEPEPVGDDVIQFDSVAELVTASEGSLAAGYYEVAGEWITHWDGSAFSPPYPNSTTSSVLMEPATGLYVGAGFFTGMTAQNRVFESDEIGAVTFCATHTIRADQISIGVAGGAGAGKSVRVLFFDSHPVTNRPSNLLYQSLDIDCSANGERTVAVDPIWTFFAGKTYWVAVWSSDALTLRGMNQNQAPWLSADFSGSSVVSYVSLVRSQDWADGTASAWSYASAQHSTKYAALVGIRVAA